MFELLHSHANLVSADRKSLQHEIGDRVLTSHPRIFGFSLSTLERVPAGGGISKSTPVHAALRCSPCCEVYNQRHVKRSAVVIMGCCNTVQAVKTSSSFTTGSAAWH